MDDARLRTELLRVRVTPEEKKAIGRAAEREHLTTSAYLRRLALAAAEQADAPWWVPPRGPTRG